ncbi:hypothetical protein E0Z10_g7407 [Xylaria hypoxylon]|uniref:Rhodopsin domain-containing protein n=1 Tax=Xylaria hypoxylon TaxID=37992 RepID=A0A4Z0YQ92_9PEZI|nr:hypothetical protein E0Z10_g7407 [Xylaria hypoxylon]
MMETPRGTLVGSFGHNTGGQIDIGIETIVLTLDYISLGLRLWSRRLQKAQYQINDWLIIIATILMTARYSLEIVAILKCGVGIHIQEVITVGGPDVLVLFPKLLYIVDLLWATIVCLLKLSILHFYIVIFPQRLFRQLTYVAMFCCIVFGFGSLFGTAFLCTPPHKKWLPNTPGLCGNEITMYVSIVTGDLITDLIVIGLPLPILWRLHLPIAKKVPLILAFGLGFAISIITSVRLKYFLNLDVSDLTYTIWPDAVLSALVPLLGILNANLLVARTVFRKIFGKMFGGSLMSSKATNLGETDNSSRAFERLREGSIPLSNLDSAVYASRANIRDTNESGPVRVTTQWEVHSAEDLVPKQIYEKP